MRWKEGGWEDEEDNGNIYITIQLSLLVQYPVLPPPPHYNALCVSVIWRSLFYTFQLLWNRDIVLCVIFRRIVPWVFSHEYLFHFYAHSPLPTISPPRVVWQYVALACREKKKLLPGIRTTILMIRTQTPCHSATQTISHLVLVSFDSRTLKTCCSESLIINEGYLQWISSLLCSLLSHSPPKQAESCLSLFVFRPSETFPCPFFPWIFLLSVLLL